MDVPPTPPGPPDLSVVLPCHDEEDCVGPLVTELRTVLDGLPLRSEVLLVDDGSEDGTRAVIDALAARDPRIRVLAHAWRWGQSAALCTGFEVARGELVATMDADGQADPADLPRLLERLAERGADAVCGVRARRADPGVKRVASRIGNGVRRRLTGDVTLDAGCTYRVVRRDALRELPVFDGLHRWLPALLRLQGLRVVELPVAHRPRPAGVSKYGVRDRALRGLADCLVLLWWRRRVVPRRRAACDAAAVGNATRDVHDAPGRVSARTSWGLLLVVALLASGVVAARLLDPDAVSALHLWLADRGRWAPPLAALLTAAGVGLGAPRLAFAVAAGLLFPPWVGVLVAESGAVVGCLAAFVLARGLRGRLGTRPLGPRLAAARDLARRHPFLATLGLRVLPVGHCQATNVTLALADVHAPSFVAATAVGILPSTVAAVLSAQAAAQPSGATVAAAGAGLLACALLGTWLARRHPVGRALERLRGDPADAGADAR